MSDSVWGWLFAPAGLTPHGFCLLWEPWLLWTEALANIAIGAAYFSIPLALGWFASQRRDLVFRPVFWLFAAFILLCGTGHWLDLVTLWVPIYRIAAVVNAITAIVSIATALLLWPLVRVALTLPSAEQLRDANASLAQLAEERGQALAALAESEARWRHLFATMQEGMFVGEMLRDAQGRPADVRYLEVNPAFAAQTGLAPEQTVGRLMTQMFPRPLDTALAGYEQALLTREAVVQDVYEPLLGRHFEVRIRAIDTPDRFVVLLMDITQRLQTEARLRESETRLARAQKLEAVGQLTSGVAHDFNNLLQIVLACAGELKTLAQSAGQPRALRHAEMVARAAERGGRLTSQLLAFSQRQVLRPETTDIGALIETMQTLLARAVGETIALDWRRGEPGGCSFVDAAQLESAILNLVINARDAMPAEGGRVAIAVDNTTIGAREAEALDLAPGEYVRVSVADTGAGIPPELLPRVFEPFFTTKDVGRGSGLGLAQVYGFMAQSGGVAAIDSTPGLGTTVSLYLPLVAAAPIVAPAASPEPAQAGRACTILVVEDEHDVREAVCEYLQDRGYAVREAADAAAARRVLESGEPLDALFSDVVLPGGTSGVELARQARAWRPGLPILLTSGYAGEALSRHQAAPDEFDLVFKPYALEELARRLAAMTQAVVQPV